MFDHGLGILAGGNICLCTHETALGIVFWQDSFLSGAFSAGLCEEVKCLSMVSGFLQVEI